MFLCEHCGNPIVDQVEGNCLWDDMNQRYGASDARSISFVHKGCSFVFEQRYPEIMFSVIGLDELIARLISGSTVSQNTNRPAISEPEPLRRSSEHMTHPPAGA